MKKGILIAFSLLVIFALATVCFAEDVSRWEYSVNIKNDTGYPITSIIPVTTIRPLIDKLIGYSCMPLNENKSSEVYFGIFDGTDVQLSGECFGEDEADNDSGGIKDNWARGKKILNGVVIRQGANTDLQINFIRR